jgi:RHS repeat-associated protein
MGFKPWGEQRFGASPTQYQYTGQYREQSLGIDFFNARWYDPALGRFLSADSIVPAPGYPGDFDRYSYARNSPIRYQDPSGHGYCDSEYAVIDDQAPSKLCGGTMYTQSKLDFLNKYDPPLPSPVAPPDELLYPGYQWSLLTQAGEVTTYYTPTARGLFAGSIYDQDPNNWPKEEGSPYWTAVMQGSVIIDGVLWVFDNGSFKPGNLGPNGYPVITLGNLGPFIYSGTTRDGHPIYYVYGAVASCPPAGGGTKTCGTPGFSPSFLQGGPLLYLIVSGNPGYVLIVNPLDSGGRLGANQIDLYGGYSMWPYPLPSSHVSVWMQIRQPMYHPGVPYQ